ncbi:hypothetical protein HNS17_19585, partial [Escherichia coli]|uniref:hypothetical protein n=1 Tax=Escherichia coli TaxID=562 RepID=UPI00214D8545
KSAGSGFERCEATARRVNHEVIHKLPGIKLSERPSVRMAFLRFYKLFLSSYLQAIPPQIR